MIKNLLLKKGVRNNRFLNAPFLRNFIVALDTYALLRSQYWPSKDLKLFQFERIKDILIHADDKVAFWRDKFAAAKVDPQRISDWNEFSRIPITYKTDFKNKPETYITDQELISQEHITDTTSGSTAEPLVFFQDSSYEIRSFSICRRILKTVAGGVLLPVIQVRARGRRGFADKNNWWFFAYNHNHLKYRIESLYQLAKSLGSPFILYGFSSYLIEIARLCKERRVPLCPTAIIATGEGLQPGQKEFIESHLGAEVYNCYTTTELGWLAQDCEKHTLHINAEFAYIEIVDQEGTPLANGKQGRIIVTTFDNKIMPFIRYDTGDLGILSDEPCACGRTLPQLKIIGRQTDMIKLTDNRSVPFLDVLAVFEKRHALIRQYQLIQKSLNEFSVKIIPEGGSVENDQLIEIANHLRRNLHPGIQVEFEIVREIPSTASGKKIYFKSLINTHNFSEEVPTP
ncbi:MAG: hypothetical protein Q8P56_06270 [Candidatus Uhrbacteria bacterium]|nr:hypothetical protein [Candidatus Uhrbacteria bacterium]